MKEPQRPQSHVYEDVSRDAVKRVFHDAGWVADNVTSDYGEDVLVSVYEDGHVTGEFFFAQIKAVVSKRYIREGFVRYPLETSTLRRWERLPLPVILITYIPKEEASYWLSVGVYLSEHNVQPNKLTSKTLSVTIPKSNGLSVDALPALRAAASAALDRVPKPHLTSLKGRLQTVERLLVELCEWADGVLSLSGSYSAAIREVDARFLGRQWRLKRQTMWNPEKAQLWDVYEKQLGEMPSRALKASARTLGKTVGNLAVSVLSWPESKRSAGVKELMSGLAKLDTSLAAIASELAKLLQLDCYVAEASTHAKEMSELIKDASVRVEQVKWKALDIVLQHQ